MLFIFQRINFKFTIDIPLFWCRYTCIYRYSDVGIPLHTCIVMSVYLFVRYSDVSIPVYTSILMSVYLYLPVFWWRCIGIRYLRYQLPNLVISIFEICKTLPLISATLLYGFSIILKIFSWLSNLMLNMLTILMRVNHLFVDIRRLAIALFFKHANFYTCLITFIQVYP